MADLMTRPNDKLAPGAFSHLHYTIKRPFLSILGRKFHVYSPTGEVVMFVKHPLLKLRAEFTVYTDETEQVPLITMKARQMVALNFAFDVSDAQTGERLGTIRSRGLKSILRDTWDILDEADQPIGLMQEDGNSFLRRLIPLLTSKHRIELGGVVMARLRQVFRFFVKEFELDLSPGDGKMDPRFAVACALLALMAEIQRESR